jgi:glutaminase
MMKGILHTKNISKKDIENIVKSSKALTGCVPNYIPELEKMA